MEQAITLFCPEAWMLYHGHVAAIRREGILFLRLQNKPKARVVFALDWFLRQITWPDARWNDYYALRWLFRKEEYCVRELHRRCHLRDDVKRTEAKKTVGRLLEDPEFHDQFFMVLIGSDCTECAEMLGESRSGALLAARAAKGVA